MPEASLWTLIISLVVLALGLTYKIADFRHTLKRTKDELSAARSEIATLNEKQNKQIQNIQMQHDTRINELTETISNLESKIAKRKTDFIYHANLLWLPNDLVPFCHRCYEVDGKEIHMSTLGKPGDKLYSFLCPACSYNASVVKHPNEI